VSDSYKHFGQINIDTRAGISEKLVLVNLGGSYDAKQLESEINAITNSIGLQWIVTEETGFRYDDTDVINKLFDKNSGLLVSYNDFKKQLTAAFKTHFNF
jgi:hypothetical protein